jgi:hydrophobe/amphiphile efflux-1 (HAE1) family protein
VTLSDLSIKNPVFAWMLMVGLIVFGWIGFQGVGKSQLPDVDFPVLTVTATWEGASPEVMEREVVDVMEDAVTQVKGVKDISSTSRQSFATITLEFDLKTDIDVALQEVESKLSQAQMSLPKDMDPPVVSKFNIEDQPFMWLSLSGDRDTKFIMEYVKDELKDQFTTIPGVGDVFLGGYVEPALRVWLDADKMRERDLAVDDVINAVHAQHSEIPAGYVASNIKEWNVRVMGEANNIKDFENIIIPARNSGPIYTKIRIKDVATVEDGLSDFRRKSRVNGQIAIGLGIKKQRGANEVAVGKLVKAKVEQIQKNLPQGLNFRVNYDGTKFVEDSTKELNFNLLLAAVLTSFICWLFLGSFSSALNIILAIPTSIVGTFIALYFLGFTQNIFTLLGLTLVIGIVVDDAIMVLENIVRHREMGESRVKAALVGTREIYFAALASSLAILAIFIPVVFIKGVIGKYFFQFGVTISVAVMLSLLEALTLAPMRCSQFLEVGKSNWLSRGMDSLVERVTSRYKKMLEACLNHRWKVVFGSILIFVSSLFLFKVVKKELMPPQDQSMLLVRLTTPVGSSLDFTNDVFKKAEDYILSRGEVDRYYAAIGGFGGGEINSGMMFITMKQPKERPVPDGAKRALTQQEFMPVLRNKFSAIPGVDKAIIQDLSIGGMGSNRGFPVEFTLQGREWDKLADVHDQFIQKMKESGLMVDIDSDYLLGMPEVQVVPDRDQASIRGVSMTTIGNAINATIGGVRIGKFSKGGRRYDIRIGFADKDRTKPSDVNKVWIRNNRGEVIPLASVVKVEEKKTLLAITRKNRSRSISIFANIMPGKSQGEALAKIQEIGKQIVPEGYKLGFSGSSETFKESFIGLLFALALGVLVAYMILGAQFNSFVHPILVLIALPFSITGAVLALKIGNQSLNMFSMIGIVLLMGIVKKNAILLVDFTNERRRTGLNVREALIEACPIRLRPIIMTSVATISAAIPPALALGPGAETRVPMSLVIIGGVAVSTFLTLFVVPCAYSLMSRLESHRHDKALQEALQELGEAAPPVNGATNHTPSAVSTH